MICAGPDQLPATDGVILPGVGNFGYAMSSLASRGFVAGIRAAAGKKPFLGICLGMQILFSSSEESPGCSGIGLFNGGVKRLDAGPGRKVPNMGWCEVATTRRGLLGEAGEVSHYYFAHSYICVPEADIVTAEVGSEDGGFAAAISSGMMHGVQFHPEKSGPAGLRVLKRFLESIVAPGGCREETP